VYFITVVTDQRARRFEDFTIACAMCRQLDRFDSRLPGKMLCWVVMPDHVHFLFQLGEVELNRVVQRLKAGSGARLNRLIGRKGPFWETGFYDHGLRHEEDARSIARYIVGNPVRAKLVDSVGRYPFWNATWL
jgi:putative transposase